ncbi:MAG: MerR family DNA-binding transcriptional regulator [Stellaceae bacterium]
MLTIGMIAKRAGVTTSAIRYYEDHGLLRPSGRLPNGYRFYGDDAVTTCGSFGKRKALDSRLSK